MLFHTDIHKLTNQINGRRKTEALMSTKKTQNKEKTTNQKPKQPNKKPQNQDHTQKHPMCVLK